MNSFERVMNTLQGLPVDRTPVLIVLGIYSSLLLKKEIKEIYYSVDLFIQAQEALINEFGIDSFFSPFDYSVFGEAFGAEIQWFNDQAPNIKKFSIKKAEDFLKLELPNPHKTGRFPFILEVTQKLSSKYKNIVPLFSGIPGPICIPALAMGMDEWLNTILFNEDLMKEILDYSNQLFIAWSNALIEAGSTALIVTEAFATQEICHRNLFEKLLFPYILDSFEKSNGPFVFHHAGGTINQNIDLIHKLPHTIGISISSKDSLTEVRLKMGNKMLLIGNLDNFSFPLLNKQQMYQKSMECLNEAVLNGPFILSHSGADISLTTPKENIRSLIKASEDFHKLRINV